MGMRIKDSIAEVLAALVNPPGFDECIKQKFVLPNINHQNETKVDALKIY